MATARSFDGALRQCRHAARQFRSPYFQTCRAFSVTTSRAVQPELPQFTETPSTELNNLFAQIRQHIFIPRRLTHQHRNLIFHKRNHDMLANDPIQVDIGSESVKLVPADRNRDVPHPWTAMRQILQLLGDNCNTALWRANFPQLMMGFRDAGVRWSAEQLARIVRSAGEAGLAPILLTLARQADSSGIWVKDLMVAREAMWACRAYAVKERWSRSATEAAARYAMGMVETLELPFQLGRASYGEEDPRVQPDMIAVVAELVAANAALHNGCKDSDGKVKQYMERMMSNIDKGIPMELGLNNEKIDPRIFDEQMTRMVPIRNAILLGNKVLGPEMPQREVGIKKMDEFDKILSDARNILRMRDLRDRKQLAQLRRSDRRSTRWNHLSRMFKKPMEGEKS